MKQRDILWQLIAENPRYLYYVGNHGVVIRKNKLSGESAPCCTYMQRKKDKDQFIMVKYNMRKTDELATLVAKTFIKNYSSRVFYITYKDGNKWNCAVDNLVLNKRKHSPTLNIHGKKVVVKEFKKEPIVYPSVRAASKGLYCSYQCLLDYLKGKSKKSVLQKWGREIYFLEERV